METIFIDFIEYRIEEIKKGGMGVVYILKRLTSRDGIDRIHLPMIAAKTVNTEFVASRNINDFKHELNVWISLDHPNIVPLLKIVSIDNMFTALMPVYSCSLRDHCIKRGKIEFKDSIRIISSVISALEYAYRTFKVTHLDVKPENILIRNNFEEQPDYYLADWGIASVQRNYCLSVAGRAIDNEHIYKTYNNFGTLPYMGPERLISGVKSSIASDVYSIGMIFYELLFGSLPFDISGNRIELQIITEEYFALANKYLFSYGNERVHDFILKCINPDPALRYLDYKVMQNDLKKIGSKFFGFWH